MGECAVVWESLARSELYLTTQLFQGGQIVSLLLRRAMMVGCLVAIVVSLEISVPKMK